jgi:hypothetical protein
LFSSFPSDRGFFHLSVQHFAARAESTRLNFDG